MADQYLIFQNFTDHALADEIGMQLTQAGIPFEIEDISSRVDPLIIGNGLDAGIRMLLRRDDFATARKVLIENSKASLSAIGEDYYLFGFTDEELHQVLAEPYDWGQVDYLLAQKILHQRGKEVSQEEMEELRIQYLDEKAQPDKMKTIWIILGYILAVFSAPIGILYGLSIKSSTKTLPNGERVFSFTEEDRNRAGSMVIIGGVILCLSFFLILLDFVNS